MVQKIFAKDEKVYGKWPGSTLYYKGVVKDYEPIKKLYTIVFDNDKSDTELSADDVKVWKVSIALNLFRLICRRMNFFQFNTSLII